jgi:hypothetical protein
LVLTAPPFLLEKRKVVTEDQIDLITAKISEQFYDIGPDLVRAILDEASKFDNPRPEGKVTPEMVRAGVHEFCHYSSDIEGPEDLVPRIYLAMCRG